MVVLVIEIPSCWKLLIMVVLVTAMPLINMYDSRVRIMKGMLDVVSMSRVIEIISI